ncbi:MAG: hypothetical protein HOP13_17990 [Alphaproteobacteria bacterium]|nr:hypothetical protein [Alphaproteobacteria bacterium]
MSDLQTATDTTTALDDGTGAEWTASLTPELKQLVETKGYKSPADVVQAYAHAQRAIGADKIPAPKDGVWDETARAKLGIPRSADGYELHRPDLPEGVAYDEAFEKAALPIAHKLGLTPGQVQGLLDFYAGHQSQAFQSSLKGRLDDETQSIGLLKEEWGPSYDTKLTQAARAARYFGGQPLIEFLNQSGIGNNPELVRAFAKIGSMMTEDSLKIGRAQGFNITPEEARREAAKLMATQAYNIRHHPEHAATVEHVQQLFERAYAGEG